MRRLVLIILLTLAALPLSADCAASFTVPHERTASDYDLVRNTIIDIVERGRDARPKATETLRAIPPECFYPLYFAALDSLPVGERRDRAFTRVGLVVRARLDERQHAALSRYITTGEIPEDMKPYLALRTP